MNQGNTHVNNGNVSRNTTYRFHNAPPDIMNNEMWRLAILELNNVWCTTQNQQCEIDSMYAIVCDVLCNEMKWIPTVFTSK